MVSDKDYKFVEKDTGMNKTLTYEEWLEKHGGKIKGNPWMSVEEQEAEFQNLYGLSLQDEVDKINQHEYQLYLQRVESGDAEEEVVQDGE